MLIALLISTHSVASVFTVDATSGPWDPDLNPTAVYGDGSDSPAFSITSGFDFTAGGLFTFEYISGLTSTYDQVPPYADANGDIDYLANDFLGNSGNYFPSAYVNPLTYPAYLNALIGTFADASGAIVGTPFFVGNGPLSVAAPTGATLILLGFNDDIFQDNTGSITLSVTGPSVVPEPTGAAIVAVMAAPSFGIAMRSRRLAIKRQRRQQS
ncbi:hypothetical protein [Lacipirellula parvula]|nr:hypothetical protein [Lacipirellula parvula]